jgi:uncharacterized protein (TIGR03083 family)
MCLADAMPSDELLPYEAHGEAIGSAATVLRNNAGAAGLEAPVPTCPGWTVRDLVVHLGMVHRWATDVVEGRGMGSGDEHAAAGRAATDLLDWFDQGASALLQALSTAPQDLAVPFFLVDAPAPRLAWCRRQAHETTIHAVDAMAARLGRAPSVDEVWFGDALALDGVDELLTGFLPRSKVRLRSEVPYLIHVAPHGTDREWTVRVGAEPPTTTRSAPDGAEPVRIRLGGSARETYLGLWNRGELTADGDPAAVVEWRELMRVRW